MVERIDYLVLVTIVLVLTELVAVILFVPLLTHAEKTIIHKMAALIHVTGTIAFVIAIGVVTEQSVKVLHNVATVPTTK